MKSVLVTGGAGYVGSVLIPRLLINRYKVYLVDSMLYGSDGVCSNQFLEVIKKDYREINFEKDKIKNVETVIHLASINFSTSFTISKNKGKLINEDGAIRFFDYCKKFSVKKFIYLTTSSIYGKNLLKNNKIFSEKDNLNPTSKFSNCEKNVQSYFMKNSNKSFSTLILRIGEIVGYSPRMRFDLMINNMIKEGFLSNKINVKNSQSKLSMLSVDYLANLLCYLITKEDFFKKSNIFNVANYSDTYRGVSKLIKEKIDLLKKNSRFLLYFDGKNEKKSLDIDIKKLNNIMPNKFKLNNKIVLDNAINSVVASFGRSRFGSNINNEKFYNDLFLKKNNIF